MGSRASRNHASIRPSDARKRQSHTRNMPGKVPNERLHAPIHPANPSGIHPGCSSCSFDLPATDRDDRPMQCDSNPSMNLPNGSVLRPSAPGVAGVALAVLAITALGGAATAGAAPSVDELFAAVVGVRTEIPESARTADVLGTTRTGSGVLIDAQGLVVTIGYLVLEASEVRLLLADGREVAARVVAYDDLTGLGLVRTDEPTGLKPMALGHSADLVAGEPVVVSPYGGQQTARPAYTVSRRAFAGYWEYLLESAIFTAPAHPMFGGAALINAQGELVGIGSLAVGHAAGSTRQLPGNMFVPVDLLTASLGELLALGRSAKPSKPWIGVFTEESPTGLRVNRVAADSPSEQAGVEAGDIIVAVGDQPVLSMTDFYRKLWASGDAGVSIRLQVLRDARIEPITVESSDRYDWLVTPGGD